MICKSDMFFETIGNRTRLKILELLFDKPMCVNDICKSLHEEQSKISHNLKKLSGCNFVDVKKKGKNRVYSLIKKTIVPLMGLVEKQVNVYCEECRRKWKFI